jgi:hypothetical protein
MRIRCHFLRHGTDQELIAAYMSALPRAGEWIMFSGIVKPMRVTMVIYDLHLSSESETQVRVLIEDAV